MKNTLHRLKQKNKLNIAQLLIGTLVHFRLLIGTLSAVPIFS